MEPLHTQRLLYTELLVKEFLMRCKCMRFPPIEEDFKVMLRHCGSLFLVRMGRVGMRQSCRRARRLN